MCLLNNAALLTADRECEEGGIGLCKGLDPIPGTKDEQRAQLGSPPREETELPAWPTA